LATCKNFPRANMRRSLDKNMGMPCESNQKRQKLARNWPEKRKERSRTQAKPKPAN